MRRPLPAIVAWSLAAALTCAAIASNGPDRVLDVQGHRGCRGLMPENSIPAFRKAIELGVTTLELDVQITADGLLVAQHDARLSPKRCVGADGGKVRATPLRLLTWEQLEGIDCGRARSAGFPEQQLVAAPIPRLDEVLAVAVEAGYPVRLSIEIKLKGVKGVSIAEVATRLVEAVRGHDLVERTIVQSFSEEVLVAVGEIEPALSLAILVRERARYDTALERSGAGILSPKFTGLSERDVRRLQEKGVAVIPWTVNDPDAIRRMIEWGVDGIISDYPDRVIDIRRVVEQGGIERGDRE